LPLVGLNSLIDLTTLKESRSEEAVKLWVVGVKFQGLLESLIKCLQVLGVYYIF